MWVKGDASNVTLKNVEITAKYYALNVNSTVDLTIENSKLNGWAAIYMFNSRPALPSPSRALFSTV